MDSDPEHSFVQREVWPAEWTPDQVANFWNWYASRPEIQPAGRADQFASRVLALTQRHVRDLGLTVDYACGLGALTRQLVRRRVRTWGFDISDVSAMHVRRNLNVYPDFLGAVKSRLRASTALACDAVWHHP